MTRSRSDDPWVAQVARVALLRWYRMVSFGKRAGLVPAVAVLALASP